jgi:predicted O-linked N-acetylglucosamine transferase (SPINDLY family)
MPGAKILLKGKMFAEPDARAVFARRFEEFGVGSHQLLVRGWAKMDPDHFAQYHEAHIALDTFPYHGTTTTCEALWMGVPVVTLEGTSHISRVGVSLLTNIGLSELIAKTEDEYVAIACRLAADEAGLRTLRMGLRERMRNSILMDGPRFAASFAAACEFMVARSAGRPAL